MKSKLEILPLALFTICAVFSFMLDDKIACLGWATAVFVQIRVITLIKIIDEDEKKF